MNKDKNYSYQQLPEPIPITEQQWSEDTVPLVCTRTMTYMHEPFIRYCIEGILMQKTTFPVRVCIHDDASTDATAVIVREYQAKYPKLIWAYYRKENTYKHPERTKLLGDFMAWASAGKYQALCEGDDYWTDPLKLQKQVEFLEGNEEYSACFTNSEIINESGIWCETFVANLRQGVVPIKDIFMQGGGIYPTASIVVRTAIYESGLHGSIQELAGDTLLIINAAIHGKVFFLNQNTCVYHRWSGGVSNSHYSREQLVQIWKKNIIGYEKLNLITEGKYQRIINSVISRMSISLILRTKMRGSLGYLKYVHLADLFRSPLKLIVYKLSHSLKSLHQQLFS